MTANPDTGKRIRRYRQLASARASSVEATGGVSDWTVGRAGLISMHAADAYDRSGVAQLRMPPALTAAEPATEGSSEYAGQLGMSMSAISLRALGNVGSAMGRRQRVEADHAGGQRAQIPPGQIAARGPVVGADAADIETDGNGEPYRRNADSGAERSQSAQQQTRPVLEGPWSAMMPISVLSATAGGAQFDKRGPERAGGLRAVSIGLSEATASSDTALEVEPVAASQARPNDRTQPAFHIVNEPLQRGDADGAPGLFARRQQLMQGVAALPHIELAETVRQSASGGDEGPIGEMIRSDAGNFLHTVAVPRTGRRPAGPRLGQRDRTVDGSAQKPSLTSKEVRETVHEALRDLLARGYSSPMV